MNGLVKNNQVNAFGHTDFDLNGSMSGINFSKFPRWDAKNLRVDIDRSLQRESETFYRFTNPLQIVYTPAASLSKFLGVVASPNGQLYFIPNGHPNVIKLNPVNDSVVEIPKISAVTFIGGVVTRNGIVVCLPSSPTATILLIDTLNNDKTSEIYVGSFVGLSGVLAENGIIYVPEAAIGGRVLLIDTNTWPFTTSFLGGCPNTTAVPCIGVVYANQGVYYIPRDEPAIIRLSTKDHTFKRFGSVGAGVAKWVGGVFNGRHIYCVPNNATQILKINPFSDEYSLFGSVGAGAFKWYGGCLSANQRTIYCAPHDSAVTGTLEISTEYDIVIEQFPGFTSGNAKYCGAVLAKTGAIYFAPYQAPSIGKIYNIDYQLDLNPNFYLNRHFNKF